jgi:hypothetical protein
MCTSQGVETMGKYSAAPGTSDAASASASGIIELATNAETQTGTDTARAVTPAGLRACTGTATRIGVLELATDAETQTGTDTARAITPANLQACTGTASRKGVLELATDGETQTGTDTARAITAANLKAWHDQVVVVTSGTTNLTTAQSGITVYLTGGAVNLPTDVAPGHQYTIINNTGSTLTVGLNTNGSVSGSGMPNNQILDNLSKTFIAVIDSAPGTQWAVIG